MKFVRPTLVVVAACAFSLAALVNVDSAPDIDSTPIKVTPYQGEQSDLLAQQQANHVRVHYFVKVGDTLSTIFSSWDLSLYSLQNILEADLESLKLDTIKPGDHLELVIDKESHQLIELVYHQSMVERAIFERGENGNYAYRFVEEPGEWRQQLYSGTIQGSFSLSAYRAGLNPNQIGNITRVLRDKINFAKELRAGDSFNVLVKEQYLGNHLTGNTEVYGITFHLRGREVAAFLAKDGRFYDRQGNSLEQAFDRYPVAAKYRRVTSHFNPRRKHPVTGRVTPHNGTDFATPVGAPVYSTGDGKVVAIRNHPYAGKYLVVEHNSVYKTRYLHLHRFLVKKGQHVKRGQKIALAGASGRITGPHLHFEVLVRNRAVDPLKANLPLASSISKQDKPEFLARISEFDRLVGNAQLAKVDSATH